MNSSRTTEIMYGAFDLTVTVEVHDEHHMGASTVLIRLSRPLRGVSEFQTTNGRAFFSPGGDGLFVCDATTILYYDLKSEQVYSSQPPAGWFLTNTRIESDELKSDLYDGRGNQKAIAPVSLADVESEFAPGMGPVKDGRFPSAYP